MSVRLLLSAACAALGLSLSAASFQAAEPVWAAGHETELNSHLRFRASFVSDGAVRPVLRITGANAYKISLNGAFLGYGPARGPKGFFRIDEWPLTGAAKGANELVIEANAAHANSYYFQDQPGFVQAEVLAGDRVLAATKAAGGAFTAETTERIRKTPRYSFQRLFSEAYRLGGAAPEKLSLVRRPEVRYLPRIASYPTFGLNTRVRVVSVSDVTYDPQAAVKPIYFINSDGKNPQFKTFAKDELEWNLWDDAQRISHGTRFALTGSANAPFSLAAGKSARLDAGHNDCGFTEMTVHVREPGRLFMMFDEILTDGELDPTRSTCCNTVGWTFERAGTYRLATFEPYVWRFADLIALSGDFTVEGVAVRGYKNPDVSRAAFRSSDPALEKIFVAARETLAQNSVDVFTDCPSRERAGWLCDSFFIGRVNALLTGETKLETLFLQNFALADAFENLPKGALAMCYPADHLRGRFIPNWCLWLILQVDEYVKRGGDRALADALKPRLVGFVDYLKTFRNADGLLEKLPSWVFVEWSHANKLVQDVNYPSNMTWAEALEAMDRLYGRPDLAAEAKKVRAEILRQSWTGTWFCDNAVRQKDGSLKLSGECTETCQYYAFYFHTATPATHPELWRTLVRDFGPKRLKADRKAVKTHPEIPPSNAFIGNYLRLECLSREGCAKEILDETKDYLLYMAERTGTLWEMISPTASCDHGFASHAAVTLFRDIIGLKSLDFATRTAKLVPPQGLDLDWVEGTLPVSPTETVTVGWRRGEKPYVKWNTPGFACGSVALSCDEPNGWTFETACVPVEPGVAEYRLRLHAAQPTVPPKFELSFAQPQTDIVQAWSAMGFRAPMPPDWSSTSRAASSLSSGIPVYSFVNATDGNRLTVSVSEAARRVNACLGNQTADCLAIGWFKFFSEPEAPISDYTLAVRFDGRAVFWSRAVEEGAAWLTRAQPLPPAVVPPAAFDPVYSTWYGFLQDISAEKIERECVRAAQLGLKTLIVDDGWQTDDTSGGYPFCGDWQPAPKLFPDMRSHVAKVQAMGLKYLLWYAVPLVGQKSPLYARFKGKYLHESASLRAAALDPRFPEVREHLATVFETALRAWNLDGFKFDFIDSFRFDGPDPAVAENYAGRDMKSLPAATARCLKEIVTRLKAIKPDLLIEFRQSYIGPVVRQFGNIIRVGDCPGDFLLNRQRAANLRLTSGATAVHSDMLEWNPGETPEDAARAILAVLFTTIQYSMVLEKLPPSHARMVRHYHDFSQAHRATLTQGSFRPHAPEANYPWIETEGAAEKIVFVYSGSCCAELGAPTKSVFLMNATSTPRLRFTLDRAPARVMAFDVFGAVQSAPQVTAGINDVACPKSGYLKIEF